jgi:hypothetical protein
LDSDNIKELTSNLKNIAAAHFIIVLAITGIIGLQITHYVLTKREERAERNAAMEAKKTK